MGKTFVGLVFIAVAGLLFFKSYGLAKNLDRYEFENRTDGGVVQFKDYDASIRHQWKHTYKHFGFGAGFLLALLGLILIATQ